MVLLFRSFLINRLSFIFLTLLVLSGCGGSADDPPGVALKSVSFAADLDANDNTAVSMDLVMIYDKNLLDTLKKMNAQQYFSGIDQIRLDNPEYLTIWRWELVPGQVANYSLLPHKQAWGVILFGDYQSPGEHRASVGVYPALSVLLKNKAFKLRQEASAPCDENIIPATPVPLSIPLNTRTAMATEDLPSSEEDMAEDDAEENEDTDADSADGASDAENADPDNGDNTDGDQDAAEDAADDSSPPETPEESPEQEESE